MESGTSMSGRLQVLPPLLPSSQNHCISGNLLLDSVPPWLPGRPRETTIRWHQSIVLCNILPWGREERARKRMNGSFFSNLPPAGPSPQRCQWGWSGLSELVSPAGKGPVQPFGPGLGLEKPSIHVLCLRAFHSFCLPSKSQARQRPDAYSSLLALRLRGVKPASTAALPRAWLRSPLLGRCHM